jgi:hypothetical protein
MQSKICFSYDKMTTDQRCKYVNHMEQTIDDSVVD